MFPITIDDVRYPCHFSTSGEAHAAAQAYFEEIGMPLYKYTVVTATSAYGKKYHVVKTNSGTPIPFPEATPYSLQAKQ